MHEGALRTLKTTHLPVTDGGVWTREVGVKKLFLIIVLCATQAACVSYTPASASDGVLLSFNDLANEITVDVETTDTADKSQLPEDRPLGTP